MNSRRYFPSAPLSDFVRCLWYWQGAPHTHSKERLLPNGESAVIFNLQDDPLRIYDAEDLTRFREYGLAIVSGASSRCFAIDACQQERVVGIQFNAGGAFPFFRAPASELASKSVDLEDLWPGRARRIRQRLLEAKSVEGMLLELERCLLEQLARPLELHPALAYAVENLGCSARVAEVVDQIGISSRRFVDLFHAQVGLTPKIFCRVRRFQLVLHRLHLTSKVDWAELALECGYYDQAHFIHDFQGFSGLTPSRYLAAATPHLNHVPIV